MPEVFNFVFLLDKNGFLGVCLHGSWE